MWNRILGGIIILVVLAVLGVMTIVDGPWRIPDDADLSGCISVNCETFP